MFGVLFGIIFKVLVFICGIIDAHKYYRQAEKVIKEGSSANISRMFLCEAFGVALFMLAYVIVYYWTDWVLVSVRIFPIITIVYLYWLVYVYYPYKNQHKPDFKRPSFWKFFLNSLTPNDKAERL